MSNFYIQRLLASDCSVRHAGDAPTLQEARQRMLAGVMREVDSLVNRDGHSCTIDVEPMAASIYVKGILQCRYTVLSLHEDFLVADYAEVKPSEYGKSWPQRSGNGSR